MSTRRLSDSESGIDELRRRYRPECVRVLLVGESSPASGKHFYLANSILFRATRKGFAQALGDAMIPHGPEFLEFLCENGWWLVDLADHPVDQGCSDSLRCKTVEAGIPRLSQTIDETCPEHVVSVKRGYVEPSVRRAVRCAQHQPQCVWDLPFPTFYEGEYVEQMVRLVSLTVGAGA